jgi:MerR family transcriptional regulator, light-induced transcriptional regulator
VVSELTAIPMGTLRAWERRYGFPKPARRKDSNRRLYSALQIEQLQNVARALEHGYRPGDVVHMPRGQLRALLEAEPRDAPLLGPSHDAQGLADVPTLVRLLAQDDVRGIEAALRFAAAALGAKRFVTECAQPLAEAVGQAWANGKLAIRHEHLLTECLSTQLRAFLALHQDAEGSPTVLLSSLPGESHTLSLQMIAVYLALSGAKPRLLGANTPPTEIASAARALDAGVVGLAVTPALSALDTRRELRVLAQAVPKSVTVWLGGSGVSALGRLPSRTEAVLSWHALDSALSRTRARAR